MSRRKTASEKTLNGLIAVCLYICFLPFMIIFAILKALCSGSSGTHRKTHKKTNAKNSKRNNDRKESYVPVLKRSTVYETMMDIDEMRGSEFEQYMAKLLSKNGYNKVTVTQASGDYGVDVIAYKGMKKYAIQCKRYAKTLGPKPVQEVHTGGVHYNADVCVVVTNNFFSDNAKTLAKETGVLLWDRDELRKLISHIA